MSSSSQTSTSLNFNGNISLTSSTPYVQTALTYSIFDNELIYSVAQNVFTKSANPFYIYTTDGLKLYVNAFSKDSYSGTGNVWYDLSGNNANVTLANSPIKSPYSFDFTGANDYATGTVAINDTTPGDTVTVEILLFGDLAHYTVPFKFDGLNYGIYCKDGFIGFNTWSDDIYGITSAPYENEYNHFTFVFKRNQVENCKMYINGNLQTLSSRISPYNNSNANFNSGSFIIGNTLNSNGYNANVRVCYLRIYNKELAQAEVTQNYIWSTKIFYPFFKNPSAPEKITQDLILDIDAGNLYSYPSSGTKVISPKPNDNPSILRSMIMPLGLSTNYIGGDVEGVLYNGVGFSTNFGGVWNFDGANDYIEFPYNSAVNNADNFTFECWFKSNNIVLEQVIFNTNNYGQSPERGYHIEIYQSKMILQVFPSQQFTFSTVTLQSNVWYFLSVTYSNGSINYYVNNVSAGTANHTFIPSSLTLLLGRYRQGFLNLNGQISNLRFYSRSLSEGERKFNYEALSPRFQVQALNNVNYLPAKEMYPDIVQTGLLLNIDPGYYKSYIGSGTTINSLVNNYTGTLNNGVGYLAKNYGQLVFDGTNDYVSIPNADLLNLGSSFTISAWVRINDIVNYSFISLISTLDISSVTKGFTLGWYKDAVYGVNAKSIMLQFGVNVNEWNVYSSDTNSITDNNFHHIAVTALNINTNNPTIIFYLDGVSKNTNWWNSSTKRPISYNTDINSIRIGHYYTPSTPTYYNGFSPINLGNVQIYTTALSAKDIKQNYYATYWKFNTQIKSGQQLYLDAGNNNSYSGSGTSILDISGNNRTGTLVNGVGFTANYDGGLIFDGTNDNVQLNSVVLSGSQDFTISAWVESTAGDGTIFANYGAGNLQMFYSPSYIGLWLNNNSAYANAALYYKPGVVNLTVQRSGGSNLFVYLDGFLIKTGSSNASIGTTSNFRIGSNSVGTELFIGRIYNIQVYSRALSFSEIQENYTAYASKFGKSGIKFLLESSSLRNLNTSQPPSIISAENLPSHTFNNIFYDKFDYGLNLTLGDTNFYEFASDFGIQQLGMYNSWLYPMGFNSDPGAKYSFNIGLSAFLDYPGAPITNTASFERNGIYRAPSNPGNKVIAYNVNYSRGTNFFYSGFLKTNLYYETTGLTGLGIGLQGDVKLGYFAVIDVRNGTGETAAFQLRKDINNTVPLATDTSITIQTDRWYRISFTWSSAGLITAKLYDGIGILISTLTVTDTSYTSGYLGITSFSLSSYDNLTNIFNLLLSPSAISTAEAFNNNNVIFPGNVNLLSGTIAKIQVTNGLSLHYDIGNSSSYNGTSTITDLQGNYNGTISGSPVLFNTYGKYLEFNTSTDLITTSTIPSSFWNNGSWTVNTWVWINAPKLSGIQRYILLHGTSGINNSWLHLAINTSGTLRFGLWNNDLDSTTALSPNRWYYISFRYDRVALTKRIYIDGVLDAQASSNAYIGTGSNTLILRTIGGRGAKVEIYNRALQPQEINQNYMANKDRFSNHYLIPKFYEQFESTSIFTEGDLDHYIRLIDYGPGYGINALFTPPYMAGYVSAAGWTGYGLARVPGESFKIVNTTFGYLSDSNFFWSGWLKVQPNYQTSSISGLGFGIQSTNTLGYFAVIDIRNGTGSSAAFQLRKDIYSTPLVTATNITIVQDEWYRITITWNDGTIIANLHNKFGDVIATLTTFDYSYTSGKVGIVSYSNASFDNFTNLTFLTISKAKIRPDLITDNLQFYYSPSNLESYQGTGNYLYDMNRATDKITRTGLLIEVDADKFNSYDGYGNIIYDLSGNNLNGALTNGPYLNTYNGVKSLYFDGVDDVIDFGNSALTNITNSGFTVGLYFRSSGNPNRPHLVSRGINGSAGKFSIVLEPNAKINVFLDNSSGWTTSVSSLSNIANNTWYHLVVTYDNAQAKIYINGVLNNTGNFAGPLRSTPTEKLFVGRFYDSGYPDSLLNGNIASFYMYSRALTAAEVLENHNITKGRKLLATLNNVTYSNDNSGSLVFNGTNSYIDVPYTQTAVTKYSISIWVKTTTGGVIIDNRGVTGSSGRSIVLSIGNSRVSYFPFNSDGQIFSLTAPTIVADNTWHHIVCVLDGTSGLILTDQNYNQYIKIYIDNVLQVISVGQILGSPALPFTGLDNLQIGRSVSLNSYFSGQIGTTQIFTKSLTPTEVRGIYLGDENPNIGTHTIKPELVNIPSGTIPSLENVSIQNLFANYNLRHLSVLSSEILPNTSAFTNIFYEQFETASSLNFGDTVNYVKSDTTDQVYGLNTFNEPPPINAGATGFGIYWFTMGPLYKPFVKYTGISGFGMKRVDNQSGNKVLIYQAQYNRSSTFFWSGFVRTTLGYITTGLSGIAFAIQPNNIYNGYFAVIDIRNGIADTAGFQLRKGIDNLTPIAFDSGVNITLDTWYRITAEWKTNGDITVRLYSLQNILLSTLSVNDNTYSTGYIGLTSYSNSLFDNFTNINSQTASPSTIATREFVSLHKIAPGQVNITQFGSVLTGETTGIHSIKVEIVYIVSSSISSREFLPTQRINPGAVRILHQGFSNVSILGSHTLLAGGKNLSPTTILTGQILGTHRIKPEVAKILHRSLINTNILGIHRLNPGNVNVNGVTSIPSQEQFENYRLVAGVAKILPSSFTVAHILGIHTVRPGVVNILSGTISSREFVNRHSLSSIVRLIPTSILTGQALGLHRFELKNNISAGTILSAEALGIHLFKAVHKILPRTLVNNSYVETPKFIFDTRDGFLKIMILPIALIGMTTNDYGNITVSVTNVSTIE